MSFSFYITAQEVVKSLKESLMALNPKTHVEDKVLTKALEEVEKNFGTMRTMLSENGKYSESLNLDRVSQFVEEICKEDVLTLVIQKLPILGWQARKDLVYCWSIFFKQKVVDSNDYSCVEYIEQHIELLDFLLVCYDKNGIAPSSGIMLRECIKFPNLAKGLLESPRFGLFFKYVDLPNFDVAYDAFSTLKDLLTRHVNVVSEYLKTHCDEFFDLYNENLLKSPNYATRRGSINLLLDILLETSKETSDAQIMKRYISQVRYLKVAMTLLTDSSKKIQLSAFDIFKVFVANPNKPREVKIILCKNKEKLLELLRKLSLEKDSKEDEQFKEEKEFIIKEIERISI